jgi:hypothetical protein
VAYPLAAISGAFCSPGCRGGILAILTERVNCFENPSDWEDVLAERLRRLVPKNFWQPRATGHHLHRQDRFIALGIFFLLSAVYLLSYQGLARSGGDEWVMFSMAESFVQAGTLETPQMLFLPVSHVAIGRIEPLQSLLVAPIYWLAVRLSQVGNVQMVMSFAVWVTALTGSCVYLTARNLGYRSNAALVAALGFGLATISWPYARTFFRESLLALWLVAAFLSFVIWQNHRRRFHLLLCALFLTFAVATKASTVIVVPAFVLVILGGLQVQKRQKLIIGLGIFLGVAGLLLLTARFRWGDKALSRLLAYGTDFFTDPRLWIRAYGLLLSPGKGLFIYSPVFFLSLAGFAGLFRRNASAGLLILLSLLSLVALYSHYPAWHGGLCWGTRFLVPLSPLLSIPLAHVWSGRKRGWAIGGWAIGLGSAAIQFVASTADYLDYYLSVVPNPYPDPENSVWLHPGSLLDAPIGGQFRIWSLESLDLLWLHVRHSGELFFNGALFAVLLAFLLFSGLYLVGLRRSSLSPRLRVGGGIFVALLLLLSLGVLLDQGMDSIQGYKGIDMADMHGIAAQTGNQDQEPRLIVSYSNEPRYRLIMNLFKGQFMHYWFSSQQLEGFEELLDPLLSVRKLWLVVDRVHLRPEDSGRELEFFLNQHLYRYTSGWSGGYELFGYVYADEMAIEHQTSRVWSSDRNGLIELRKVYLESDAVIPGQVLPLAFDFYCLGRMQENFKFFVHLIDAKGRDFPGYDGEPLFGALPTAEWVEGELIHDRRAYALRTEMPPGRYQIVVGFYDNRGERLTLESQAGPILQPNAATVAEITVLEGPDRDSQTRVQR